MLCIIMFAVMAATAVGQTQQGYVKTRGKLAADGKTVVQGERLSNVIVTIENLSPVKSDTNGTFSFALPAGTNRYRLQGAELKGYTLADPDAIRQTHTYSKDLPLIVVLEDMKQREADLEAARKSVRNVMKREIRKKQDELDSLRDAHAITQAKYDSLVHDFWEYRQSSENLVNEMAERYISTDYDQLDDFNRQVQAYIESGQLTKADSMIRTKGSLEERFNRVKQYEATIQQQQKTLDYSRQYTQKEKEDLSNDLYRQHLIFLQQPLMQDSALYCMKLRADLDTTNLDAVWDYALLSDAQHHFVEAEKYYFIYLNTVTKLNDIDRIAKVQNNLGALYQTLHDTANSEKYLKLALGNIEQLYAANPEACRANLAMAQSNLGTMYSDLLDSTNGEKHLKLALEIEEKLFADNPNTYRAGLFIIQLNLGILYNSFHNYVKSSRFLKLALENIEILYAANPDSYRAHLAKTQSSFGYLYHNLHDTSNCDKYYKLALGNYEQLYAVNPEGYRADIAGIQYNLGTLYRHLHHNTTSERYYRQALENYEQLFATNPGVYRADLARTQRELGGCYKDLHADTTSERYLKQALENYEHLYVANPEVYRADLASTQNDLGLLYCILKDSANSENYLKLALRNYEHLYIADPDAYLADLAMTQNNLGYLYYNLHDAVTCKKYFEFALESYEQLYIANPEAYRAELATAQNNLGGLYIDLHDNANSEKYLKLALVNRKRLYASNPRAYREDLAKTYYNLVLLYNQIYDMDCYDTCLSISLELYRVLYASDSSTYKQYVIELQNRVVWQYLKNGAIDEALAIARENCALDKTNGKSRYYLAECLSSKAIQYAYESYYTQAINTINEAIELVPSVADLFDSKGRILLMQGNVQEALKMWQKVLELSPRFLDDYPEGTNLSNGLKAKGLIK